MHNTSCNLEMTYDLYLDFHLQHTGVNLQYRQSLLVILLLVN